MEGTAAIKSSLDKLEVSASKNFMMVNQDQGKSPALGIDYPQATLQPGNNPAEKDLAILVDKRSLEHMTYKERLREVGLAMAGYKYCVRFPGVG
ncbi:hypothetical protein GRJ2_001211400 [Grus japonensis]|uniref:Uncharacterized protein n=1 Tax=Grus japonensis TaxID=30415 RepID=A0ABC9WQM5_GRUJA